MKQRTEIETYVRGEAAKILRVVRDTKPVGAIAHDCVSMAARVAVDRLINSRPNLARAVYATFADMAMRFPVRDEKELLTRLMQTLFPETVH